MRAHPFGVNAKNCDARHRVLLIWSSMLWFTSLKGVSMITKQNIVCGAISMCFLIMPSDVPNPRYTTLEPNKHTFGMMQSVKREFTVNEMCDIVDKMWRQLTNILKGALQKYRDPQKGYSATFDDFHGHIFSDEEYSAGPVDMEDIGEGEVSQQIWNVLFPILNGINVHVRLFLQRCFNVDNVDISPFAEAFSQDVRSLLKRFLAYMPRQKNTGNPEENNGDNNINDNDEDDDNSGVIHDKATTLTAVQDGMIKDIIHAAGCEEEDDNASENEEEVVEGFVQSIYGTTGTTAEMAGNFGNMITATISNKHEWPLLLQTALADLVMKNRDKGSTTSNQKFKGLNA